MNVEKCDLSMGKVTAAVHSGAELCIKNLKSELLQVSDVENRGDLEERIRLFSVLLNPTYN